MQEPGSGAPARLDDAGRPPAIRASDRERDAATQRLQEAFAEGRLDDGEFDQRMRTALSARTRPELDGLLTDLPQPGPAAGPAVTAGRPPGRLAVAFKSSVRRAGRWRVPEHYRTVVYKGSGWLDLRAAELTAAETTLLTVAYKSNVTILVPPGVRVEASGFGADTDTEAGPALPAGAPVIHVRGFTYKGTIRVRNRPPEDPGTP